MPASHPLDGCVAKVAGAKKALARLEDESTAFLRGNPLKTTGEFKPETGKYVELLNPPPEVPIPLSVIVGEYLHDIRSALDLLAWELIGLGSRGKRGSRTCFPIYTDPDDFTCEVIYPAKKGRSGPLTGLDPSGPEFALVERHQPYHGGNPSDHPLNVIRILNNIDKHRTLHGSFMRLDTPVSQDQWRAMFTWPTSTPEPLTQDFHLRPGQRLEARTKVATFIFPRLGSLNPGVVMKGQLPIAIDFGEGKGRAGGQGLYDLGLYIDMLLDLAKPFFG